MRGKPPFGQYAPRQSYPSIMYPHLGSFESTNIFGTGHDILEGTRHLDLWSQDLQMLWDAGIRDLRYPVPWHRIERTRGEYDWSWIDGPMRFMRSAGMRPILDPLHHTSFPSWLEDGFLHPEFPTVYGQFIDEVSNRYGWVTNYTIVNEPLPTTLFCSLTGMWYPHHSSERQFAAMSMQVARAICLCANLLKRKDKNIKLVHVDTAEHHLALSPRVDSWVEHANERRFLIHDLILGCVDHRHPLYSYLLECGASVDGLCWFQDHPGPFDVLGLDYYLHSEMEWFWNEREQRPDIHPLNRNPRGFAAIAEDYVDRFRGPVMLAETNVRGTVQERLRWLKFMEEQCELLVAQGLDFRGFCWFPSIDSTDWSSACTNYRASVDPQGIWSLDDARYTRHPSELSSIYSRLARGEIASADIVRRELGPTLARRFEGYLPLESSSLLRLTNAPEIRSSVPA